MPYVLRTSTDISNPTLPGGIYGSYVTEGMPVYYRFDGTQTKGIIFIGDGGLYGLDRVLSFEYKGTILTPTTNWIFHPGTLSTGFSDLVQGLPTFCPEADSTFNNIAYIEFALPAGVSSATDPPSWSDFRIVGIGRKLKRYSSIGSSLGVVGGALTANIALQVIDNFLVNMRGRASRINWPSFNSFYLTCNVPIWQRTSPSSDTADVSGINAEYFSDQTFGTSAVTRLDSQINFSFGTNAPAPGMATTNYSVRWTGKIVPKYSESYTFSFVHDDYGKVIVNGTTIINNSSAATDTGSITLTAGVPATIVVEMSNNISTGTAILSWSSSSQASQIIPPSGFLPPDIVLTRYAASVAYGSSVEAADVHENLMAKAPGWEWSDRDGLITFLAPSRSSIFTFTINKTLTNSGANFKKNSFIRTRRPLSSRKNFLLFRFRNIEYTGFPLGYVQGDRDDLRRFMNSVPTNDPATDIGPCNRSLAQRIAEYTMVINTDPDHTANISGGRETGNIRKSDIVTVTIIDTASNTVVNQTYLVTYHGWGSMIDENAFILLPVSLPLYTDEPA